MQTFGTRGHEAIFEASRTRQTRPAPGSRSTPVSELISLFTRIGCSRFGRTGNGRPNRLLVTNNSARAASQSVRGYHEGEVFGDTGWHVSLEQQTPPHVVGFVGSGLPLTVRGSIYTDFAQTYLLDPQGRPADVALWGAGVGSVVSVGRYWDARFLFSVPFLAAGTTRAYQPYFNFNLTAQF